MENNLEIENLNLANYIIMERETLYGFKIADWYCSERILKRGTPSILFGMSYATELRYRTRGIQFIKDLAAKLELGYKPIATAALFFHRFYLRRGFQHFPEYRTAASCLYLAGKVDETPKLSTVILHQIRQLLSTNVYLHNYGENDKKEFYIMERVLLHTLNMDFSVDHPYSYIVPYAKTVINSTDDASLRGNVAQMAWNFINDSLYISLCIQYKPKLLAIAALYLASELNEFEVVDWVDKQDDHIAWWDSFVDDLSVKTIQGITIQITKAYEEKENLEKGEFYLNNLESHIYDAPASLSVIRLIPDSLTPNSYNLVLSSSDCPMLTDSSTDITDESNKSHQNHSNIDPAPLDVDPTPLDIQQPNRSESRSSSTYYDGLSLHSSRGGTPSFVQADIDNGVYRVPDISDELKNYGHDFCGCYNNHVRNPIYNDDDSNSVNDRDNTLHEGALIPHGQRCIIRQHVSNWLESNNRFNEVDDNSNTHDGINNNDRDGMNNDINNSQRENTLPSIRQGSQKDRQNRGQNGEQNDEQNHRQNRRRNRKPNNRKPNGKQNRKKNRKRRFK